MRCRFFCVLLVSGAAVLLLPMSARSQGLAFVPIASSARVEVLDLRDGTSVRRIPVAATPISIAIDALHGRAYVAHQTGNRVTVIDTSALTVIGSLDLPSDAWAIALSPDGDRAYVSLSGMNALGVIDTASLSLLTTVPTGATPRGVALSADGARVYVANQSGGSISIVDTGDNSPVGTYALCSAPLGLALQPGGAIVYAACGFDSAVVRFDTVSLSVQGTTTLPSPASEVAVSADGARVYASRTNAGQVSVIDGINHAVLAHVAVGDGPYGLSLSTDGSKLYASNLHSASMSVIDISSNTEQAVYPLFSSAFAVGSFLAPANVPEPPRISTATAGDTTVTLAFAAPGFDGGAAILDFTATCGSATLVGTAPVITLTGLSNGVSYTCKVTARNEVGSSMPSASVQVTPARVPSAPTLTQITPGTEQATILFNAPADDGGSPITHYSAQCNPGSVSDQHEFSPIIVGGLSDGVVYRCSVRAHNGVGAGALSNELSVIPGDHGSSADLAISKTNGSGFIAAGNRVGYLIVVSNPGPAAVAGARVTDNMEAYFSDPEWTCVGNAGAACAVSGQGNLDLLVDLPIGSSADIRITALLAPLPEDPVSNVAAVGLPAVMSDPEMANNVASDGPDIRGIFWDEFE